MARGKSGRIVVEIDPSLKSELYDALQDEGVTLKDWFLRNTGSYLAQRAQPSLFSSPPADEVKHKAAKMEK